MSGFWEAVYDAVEATVDGAQDWFRGHTTYEAAARSDDREDRALIRAGHDPHAVASRREALDAEESAWIHYDFDVGQLKDGFGWRRDESNRSLPSTMISQRVISSTKTLSLKTSVSNAAARPMPAWRMRAAPSHSFPRRPTAGSCCAA